MRKVTRAIIAVLCVVLCMSVFFACDTTPEHEHDYKLKSDETHHWYECEADGDVKVDSKAEHVDENRDGKCDECQHAVDVVNLKGISFDIKGNDGGNDVELNGKSVTITYKSYTHTATVANGKFTVADTELVYLGTYTVSADGYFDGSVKITKDGASAVVLNVKKEIAYSATVQETENGPVLVVEGMIPTIEGTEIGNLMLHYKANEVDYYVENTTKYQGTFRFELALSKLPVTDTPWCWFHLYPYAEENPTETSTPLTTEGDTVNLNRGSVLQNGDSWDYNGVTYTVQQQGESKQLIIQPTPISGIKVNSIEFDTTTAVPELVVKGVMPTDTPCVKLHIWSAKGEKWWENTAKAAGSFEFRAPLSDFPTEETPYCWFHIWTYDDANAADNDEHAQEDLARNNLIEAGSHVDYNGVRYMIPNEGQLVMWPTSIPAFDVTSIAFEGENLVVKGILNNSEIKTAKLHIWSAKGEKVWQNTATEVGKFEFTAPLSDFPTEETPYCWFHLWLYANENAADNDEHAQEDLARNNLIKAGTYVDANGVRYMIPNESQLVMWPTTIPEEA